MKTFGNFRDAIIWARTRLKDYGYEIKTEKWQGLVADDKHTMLETLNTSFVCQMTENIDELVNQIRPNLPWADDHFWERVGGVPLNPPPSHEWWPFTDKSNNQFREEEIFSHTYPERIWPKHAGTTPVAHAGIRYPYGDFQDIVNLLAKEPYTRQAFLPIWFPEDTGVTFGGRVPCFTAGTMVQTSNGYLDIKDILEGNLVMTHMGRFRKVEKKYISKYSGKMVKISTRNTNTLINSTPDHPFLVVRSNGHIPSDKEFIWDEEWVNAEDLKEGDYVVHSYPDNIERCDYSPEIMRLFGYYLAEGEILFDKRGGKKKPKGIRFNMSRKDQERGFIKDLSDIIEKEIGNKLNYKVSSDPNDSENIRLYLHDVNFAKIVYELFGSHAFHKRIPLEIINVDPLLQYQLLIGYTRGDGSYDGKKNIECTSVSKSIIMGLRIICFRNNIYNSLQEIPLRPSYFNKRLNRTIKPNYPSYKLTFSQGGRLLNDFFNINENENENEREIFNKFCFKNNRVLFRINNVDIEEKENEIDVYNLQVEEDNSYNITNCSVHNCTIGYHFIRRGDHLHIVYYIRSCDIIRHFQDDIYLACRKVIWLLNQLRERDHEQWKDVRPGMYTMHITSLHCFKPDQPVLLKYNLPKA
jgi:hypothetical protein